LARNSAKIEYITGGQPSPNELAFEVELGLNPHYKMVSKPILDPFKGSPIMLSTHQAQNCLRVRRYNGKNSSLTLARDSAKIEYISGGQPSPYELAFRVKLDPNPHSKKH